MRRWQGWLLAALGLAGLMYWWWPVPYCRSAKSRYGLELPLCPEGDLRQVFRISAQGLQRGAEGRVRLSASALYTVAAADRWQEAVLPSLEATLSLIDGHGKEQALEPTPGALKPRRAPIRGQGYLSLPVVLPTTLGDGDYRLRAKITTRVGKGVVELALPLYAPARIHLLTDRPLYEAGQRVRFRALVVRARDLSPLDGRPGRWLVKNPAGEVVLEEKAAAGPWGVVAGDFLLDGSAPRGRWSISWVSGKATGSTTITVEPFTLPRFKIVATPHKPFYRAGEQPLVKGRVVYSSGAPVGGANLSLTWTLSGAWPAPPSWQKSGLPKSARTDPFGNFSLALPVVPQDLQGQVSLSAAITAIDPAGDRVEGAVELLLSQHAIRAAVVTSWENGLAGGFNNRLYLRVLSADGQALPGATISLRKRWLKGSPPIQAQLDANSVARLQFDPGPPVMVTIPAPPHRPVVDRRPIVERTRAHDLVRDVGASLDDQVELDRWGALLVPCAKYRSSDQSVAELALQIDANGSIRAVSAEGELGRCVREKIARRRFPRAWERLYALRFEFAEPRLPSLSSEPEQAVGELASPMAELFAAAARDARDCLPRHSDGQLGSVLLWRLAPKAKAPTWRWAKRSGRGIASTAAVQGCIDSRLKGRKLAHAAERERFGVVRYRLSRAIQDRPPERARPRVMRGYELLLAAEREGKTLGETVLRIRPATIPALSLRAAPVLAQPGGDVSLRLLRGPSFRGSLPRAIGVEHRGKSQTIKLAPGEKATRYTLPKDAEGWFRFQASGASALVFVRGSKQLTVDVRPERPVYAPGEKARLKIVTRLGGQGATAAVGLFGVDASLAQLVKLPGADALGTLRPAVTMREQAFGVLDANALVSGQIRGEHAAEATVLRVASIPAAAQLDAVLNLSARTHFDPIAELTDRFYEVLAELYQLGQRWERTAPKGELMRPATMAKLWEQALDAAQARGMRVDDAFGRRLALFRLPGDLLELTNPRQVITEGTRLPEDVENWAAWVAARRPR